MSATGSDASHAPEASAPGTPPARAMTSSRTADRAAGRTVAVVLALLLGALLLLLSAGGAVPNVLASFTGNFNGEAEISTPRIPFVDSWAEIDPKGTDAAYAGVLISSPEPLVASRALQATTAGLESLSIIVGSLLVVLMSISLLRGRGFSRLARWGLAGLGLLIMLTAVLAPQLDALAVDRAGLVHRHHAGAGARATAARPTHEDRVGGGGGFARCSTSGRNVERPGRAGHTDEPEGAHRYVHAGCICCYAGS